MSLSEQALLQQSHTRKALCQESFRHFWAVYFNHLITHKSSEFHQSMWSLMQQELEPEQIIIGYPGCGKTVLWTAYLLWQILSGQIKYAVWMTREKIESYYWIELLAEELKSNERLQHDFEYELQNWKRHSNSIRFPHLQAKIEALPITNSIAHKRYHRTFIELIIVDDLEPASDEKERHSMRHHLLRLRDECAQKTLVWLGNNYGVFSLLSWLEKQKVMTHKYPLLTGEKQENTWPDMFPKKRLQQVRKEIGQDVFIQLYAHENLLISPKNALFPAVSITLTKKNNKHGKYIFIPPFGGGNGKDPTPVFCKADKGYVRFIPGVKTMTEANKYAMKDRRKYLERGQMNKRKLEKMKGNNDPHYAEEKAQHDFFEKIDRNVAARNGLEPAVFMPMLHQTEAQYSAWGVEFLNYKNKENMDEFLDDLIQPLIFPQKALEDRMTVFCSLLHQKKLAIKHTKASENIWIDMFRYPYMEQENYLEALILAHFMHSDLPKDQRVYYKNTPPKFYGKKTIPERTEQEDLKLEIGMNNFWAEEKARNKKKRSTCLK